MPGSARFALMTGEGVRRVFSLPQPLGMKGDAMTDTMIEAQQIDDGAVLILAGDVDLSCVGTSGTPPPPPCPPSRSGWWWTSRP